jgi:hypothetical protein
LKHKHDIKIRSFCASKSCTHIMISASETRIKSSFASKISTHIFVSKISTHTFASKITAHTFAGKQSKKHNFDRSSSNNSGRSSSVFEKS